MSISASEATGAPLSPCQRNCRLDAQRSHCITCLRSREEITAWGRMDNDARRAIMDALPARQRATR